MSSNFTGIITIDFCPKCQSRNQIDYDDNFAFDHNNRHYLMFAQCHICKKTFMYEYSEYESKGQAKVLDSLTELEFVYRYPSNEATTYDSVPSDIRNSYLEAMICLNSNAPNAAVMLFRRTLQQICKAKGAIKGDLKDQIKSVMPTELRTEADELRHWGNLGAHPDDIIASVSIDDAKDIEEFIDKVLYSLYEYPARIQNKQSKRTGNKP